MTQCFIYFQVHNVATRGAVMILLQTFPPVSFVFEDGFLDNKTDHRYVIRHPRKCITFICPKKGSMGLKWKLRMWWKISSFHGVVLWR